MEDSWLIRFKKTERLVVERICKLLPVCKEILENDTAIPVNKDGLPKEEVITRMIRRLLMTDSEIVVRFDCFHQFEINADNEESDSVLEHGKVDIVICWRDSSFYEKHLAIEVKRLRTGDSGLLSKYVDEGVLDFVNGKYASGMPLGVMFGIEMDGNMTGLKAEVTNRLKSDSRKTRMISGPTNVKAISTAQRFQTEHERISSNDSIILFHSLVPYK